MLNDGGGAKRAHIFYGIIKSILFKLLEFNVQRRKKGASINAICCHVFHAEEKEIQMNAKKNLFQWKRYIEVC